MAIPHVLFTILFVSTVAIVRVESYNDSEERLRYDLFRGYDVHTRPSNKTKVSFRVTIKHFEMMEQTHSMVVNTWMVNEWRDPRLQWYPDEYGGIQKITVPHTHLWTPDLGVYNSGDEGKELSYGNTLALVFSTGKILFVPPIKLHFTCVMDLTLWPHDTHSCTCVMGSWIHDGFQVELKLKDDKPEVDLPFRITDDGQNMTRGAWNLLRTNITRKVKTYDCCPEPYITLHMSMVVSRNAPAYEWTIKGPAIGLSILTLVLFMLPPAAGEKLIFGVLCLLLDMVYIAFTSYTISMAPNHTPLIVQMICKQAMLVIGSIVFGALSLRFARDPHTAGLPPFIKRPLLFLASFCCLTNYRNLASRVHHHPYSHSLKPNDFEMKENGTGRVYQPELGICPGFDWLLLAAFMDRACLVIYVIIFIVNIYSFSVVL